MKSYVLQVENEDSDQLMETIRAAGIRSLVIPSPNEENATAVNEDARYLYDNELPDRLLPGQRLTDWESLPDNLKERFARDFVIDASPVPEVCSVPGIAAMKQEDLAAYLQR